MVYLLFACAQPQPENQSESSVELLAELEAQLSGYFTSEAQSQENPAYYNIQLRTCAVDAPELGDHVLYVEQAQTAAPEDPYRQRLYVLDIIDEAEQTVQSTIYSLKNNSWAVGLCTDEREAIYGLDDITLREGCEVILQWNGTGFSGSTVGENCESTLSGASYATSEVTTTPNEIRSWDQGFNAEGEQVWGAVEGPYLFLRQD